MWVCVCVCVFVCVFHAAAPHRSVFQAFQDFCDHVMTGKPGPTENVSGPLPSRSLIPHVPTRPYQCFDPVCKALV
jgi:hypothetical protein